jgi:signal transduction histidine kinase
MTPHAGARILVIDDEATVRGFLVEALTDHGYVVDAAEDGRQAIEKIRRNRYDAAVCDLLMPEVDGLETLAQAKALNPDIEFVMLTAHGTMENAVDSLRKGAFDFLLKPVNLTDLHFAIDRALERREFIERLGLYELSRSIFSTLNEEELYGRVVQSAIQVLRADDASLMLKDESNRLYIALSTSLQQEILADTHLALGERVAGRVALLPEPVVINDDVAGDDRFGGVQPWRPINAAIVCPLTMRGQLLGVLNVNRVTSADRYTERDRRNAMILASLVALALGNARLHKELLARLEQLRDTQEEVIQSEKMTALGNLLSGVAHELNNPLCGVLGYAQLMQQEELSGKLRKGVDVILREADRAAKIVGNLLKFARREKAEKKPLGINGVILKTIERKAYDLKVSRVEVKADLDPNLPYVNGDFHQLQVMFMHLINNAQQAMFDSHGGGTLTVRTEPKDSRILITLADDGPGISPENVRRVFDPFFTTKGVGKGTGLGLSVCFAIVRDHGGVIRCGGEPGKGAVFTLELPVASPGAQQAQVGAAAPAQAGAAPVPVGAAPVAAASSMVAAQPEATAPTAPAPRVLVADTEVHVQDVLVELLGRMGYRVDTADSGEGALAKIRGGSYDALIADYAMPRLDGRALLDILKAEKPALASSVIFLSSDTANPRLAEFAAATGSVLLGKPFDIETMRSTLRRLVARSIDKANPTIH